MKMKYAKPEIEISVFDTEDIITVSNETETSSVTSAGELSDSHGDAAYSDIFGSTSSLL